MAKMRKPSPQTRKVLELLMEAPQAWRHGYELSQETGLKSGTLYPLLIRLSDQGLLEAEWRRSEHAGRPPRHLYRLTPDGLALARSLAESTAAAPGWSAKGAPA